MSNIIEASERFSARETDPSNVTKRLRALEHQVNSHKRLPWKDRALMARKLGDLAVRLSPDAPLNGARQMFEKSGDWERKWRKRDRLLVLPDDAEKENAVLESQGAPFIRLARAAGELLAAGSAEPLVERRRLAAVRELLQGTMFIEDLPPESASLATGRELLTDGLARIARNIDEKTSLRELWSVLETAPFERYLSYNGNDLDFIDFKDELSISRAVAVESAVPHGKDPIYKFGPSTSQTGSELPSWSRPSIKIGCLAIERLVRIFRFPESAVHILVPDEEDEDSLCREGLMEMAEFGAEGGRLPDDEYDPKTGLGWQEQKLWQIYSVFLIVERNFAEELEICISFQHACDDLPTLIPVTGHYFDDPVIMRTFDQGGGFLDWSPQEFSDYLPLFSPTWPSWWGEQKFQPGQFLGYLDVRLTDERPPAGEVGPVSDDWIAAFVFGSEGMRFFPQFETDKSRPALLRPGSIGEALMQNLAQGDPKLRLDTFLCAAADKIAAEGLAYHRSLVEHYRDRLGTL